MIALYDNTVAEPPLTLERAIAIQQQQIDEWSLVLSEKALAAIKAQAEVQNAHTKAMAHPSPYDVWRGTDIDAFIGKICCGSIKI